MDARAYLAERARLVDRRLDAVLPPEDAPPHALHRAMRHLVFPGGKRLRPVLAMAAAEAVGRPPEAALPVAVAVELIHTYSLIHDDLPCMDDDALRRGRPTVHVAHGEAVAVLAGDALQALAFQVVAESDAPSAAPVVADLARAAGAAALVGGQVDDLAFEAGADPQASIESIHARKSAALIAVSLSAGARLAGADAGRVATLERFGGDVGVAFQIADDVLDASEDESCSLVAVLGIDGARQRAESLLDGALAMIDDWGERAEPLRELARFAVRRDR